jgi:hypothetical protein
MMLLSAAGGRNPLFALAVSAGAVIVFIFGIMAWQSPSMPFTSNPPHMSETYVAPPTSSPRGLAGYDE